MRGWLGRWKWTPALGVLCAALGGLAHADAAKVEVNSEVVLMSNQCTTVDPALTRMKDTFSKEHFNFTCYKLVSPPERLSLEPKHSAEVKLPNARKASLTVESLEKGVATVSVSIQKGVTTTYTLGREGSVFINAGHLADGEVFLVLSPITGHKGRGLAGILRPNTLVDPARAFAADAP